MLKLVQDDPWLTPQSNAIDTRFARYQSRLENIGDICGPISLQHKFLGIQVLENGSIVYREWAPHAFALSLIGDFNDWNRDANLLIRRAESNGYWELLLPAGTIAHDSKLKVHVIGADGSRLDRIPALATRVIQDESTKDFSAQFWHPENPYQWMNPAPILSSNEGLRIYEAHIGMAQDEGKVGSIDEFREKILPRIASLGYNAIQLMALAEHPYYGSFGYHISSFFALSSRFGTPEEFKALVDAAHKENIVILMDIVHSHAVKNIYEGLNKFDGTENQYFNSDHPAWDSKCFDYARPEVESFLLSNVRYWLEEYKIDGFRFDGVTSMLYHNHGLGFDFASYDDYFNSNVNDNAVLYLQLANNLIHTLAPNAITIAEDMSGMPGMARPITEGGLGFDYRLAMGVPDFWIKTLKEQSDDEWNLESIYGTLLNRRHGEKHIGYAESHDQALVGDKTLAFRLMDAAMYDSMATSSQNLVIDRGIALHKLIRLLTFTLAGEGWLNFMGNEFGHPEWVDFPREGNGWSYQYARRQWPLVDNTELRYQHLNAWEAALLMLDKTYHTLTDPHIEKLYVHDADKVIVYRRGNLVVAINLHPTNSYIDYAIGVPSNKGYKLVLDSDATQFGGHSRLQANQTLPSENHQLRLYLPSRTGQVLVPS
jgi:1,4-alpha-glucan branching enzyme